MASGRFKLSLWLGAMTLLALASQAFATDDWPEATSEPLTSSSSALELGSAGSWALRPKLPPAEAFARARSALKHLGIAEEPDSQSALDPLTERQSTEGLQ